MPQRVLDDLWRSHWGRLLGQLMARFGRADLVEDALAEAFAQAAARWPTAGIPQNPPGWIHTVAQRRVLDELRRERTAGSKAHLIADDGVQPGPEEAAGLRWATPGEYDGVDERLPLLFMATHPALSEEVRPALALRFVLGVPTADIARLFLVPTATMAARLTRAKKRITNSGIPFTVPDRAVWPERLDDVARAIYLAFTAGYAPASGVAAIGPMAGLAILQAASEQLPGHHRAHLVQGVISRYAAEYAQ